VVIYVTERDIKHGMRRSVLCCPVQRAIYRRLRIRVMVGGGEVQYDGGFVTPLPIKVRERIRIYDGGGLMKPSRSPKLHTAQLSPSAAGARPSRRARSLGE
jgi:hypothetical protein